MSVLPAIVVILRLALIVLALGNHPAVADRASPDPSQQQDRSASSVRSLFELGIAEEAARPSVANGEDEYLPSDLLPQLSLAPEEPERQFFRNSHSTALLELGELDFARTDSWIFGWSIRGPPQRYVSAHV